MSGLELLSAIGSLASIASLLEKAFPNLDNPEVGNLRADGLDRYDMRREPSVFATIKPSSIAHGARQIAAQEATRADISKLDDLPGGFSTGLIKKAKEAESNAAEELEKDGITLAEIAKIRDRMVANVCGLLREIKSVNGGVLPSDDLYEKWVRLQCA